MSAVVAHRWVGWCHGRVDGVVDAMLCSALRREVPDPKEPPPQLRGAAKSLSRPDLLHRFRCTDPCTYRPSSNGQLSSRMNTAESRTKKCPSDQQLPPYTHRTHRRLNSPWPSRRLALRRRLFLRCSSQASPCPCPSPEPPECSSVKCIADVACLYYYGLSRIFSCSLPFLPPPSLTIRMSFDLLTNPWKFLFGNSNMAKEGSEPKPLGSYPESGISVLIVGTGLAGLTAAIECIRKGHKVQVLERDSAINTAGLYTQIVMQVGASL